MITKTVDGKEVQVKILPYKEAIKREYSEKPDKCQKNYEKKRSPFLKDTTRIAGSQTFLGLGRVTQVQPISTLDGSLNVRTRINHSCELSLHARRVALEIGLDPFALEAIIYGHDLGHVIFAHAGTVGINQIIEKLNSEAIGKPIELFDHELQTYRIVTQLEYFSPRYRGLNLTSLVRNAFLNRSKREAHETELGMREHFPQGFLTLEEQLAEVIDKFYVYHDFEDLLGVNMYSTEQLTKEKLSNGNLVDPIIRRICRNALKTSHTHPKDISKAIYNILIVWLYENLEKINISKFISQTLAKSPKGSFIMTNPAIIGFGEKNTQKFSDMLKWMYKNVYTGHPMTDSRDDMSIRTVVHIFDYLFANNNLEEQIKRIRQFNRNRLILELDSEKNRVQSIIDLLSTTNEIDVINFLRQYVSY